MCAILISLVTAGICIILLFHLYQGPGYVPTHNKTVVMMVHEADIKKGMKVADLGSGDGRVVIAMAQKGALVTGFEINPFLVWYSKYRIKKAHLLDNAKILSVNFWGQNLGEYDVITVFGIDHVMDRLGKKLALELKPNALVISNAFVIPELMEIRRVGSLRIYRRR